MTSDFNLRIIEEFRTDGGRVGGPFEGAVLALLTTTGARTGKARTSPLGFVRDDDRLLIVASAGGAPTHPAWYHNLIAHPRVTVEIGDGHRIETTEMIAVPATGGERDRLFARVVEEAPGYADYQSATSRVLPVVVLHRVDAREAERLRAVGDELVKLHTWFREELTTLRTRLTPTQTSPIDAASNAEAAGPPWESALRLRCLEFCQGLERHHTGEDLVVFPHLEGLFPELGPALRTLRDEHHVVARIRTDLHTLLTTEEGDNARLQADFDRLAEELTAHLDHEEALLVPVMNTLGEAPWPNLTD
ncbi:nitroreductase/quinone reductase family protein [Spirillospora sp. NPDC047279]|uniref:nitroreductase/quinone reductase family protein n=1 Tax=Spirillospora sp. NPDC047279 TaxID=3155478 RepID=UPI003404F364